MIIAKAPLKYKDGTSPKVIMFNLQEMMNWGGGNCCDLCNEDIITEENGYGFIIPNVYGAGYAICQDCYNKVVKRNKLYEEDKHMLEEQAIINHYSRFADGGLIIYEK